MGTRYTRLSIWRSLGLRSWSRGQEKLARWGLVRFMHPARVALVVFAAVLLAAGPAAGDVRSVVETIRQVQPKVHVGRVVWLTWAYKFLFEKTCKYEGPPEEGVGR